MEEKQVKLFYEEMKNTFVKPNSDWVDKAKTFRTLLEKCFQNLTPELDSQSTLWERMVAYYDANPDEDAMRSRVHRIRKKLNDIVHDELEDALLATMSYVHVNGLVLIGIEEKDKSYPKLLAI